VPPATIANPRCFDPQASASITTRRPDTFFMVTGLTGRVSNPSSGQQHVTAIYLEFIARPPGATSARLKVDVDLLVPAGGEVSWEWQGEVLVRPIHDDAPQPEATDTDWVWTDEAQRAACPGF